MIRVIFNVRYDHKDMEFHLKWDWPWSSQQRSRATDTIISIINSFQTTYDHVSIISSSSRKKIHLTKAELQSGCKLGFDSFADTCCAGRHARVESFLEGRTVTAKSFSDKVPTLKNLPIANVLYAYDTDDGQTFILRVNNSIYLGDDMEDSLLCPNQCRDIGIEIDTRPKRYCDDITCEKMFCPDIDKSFPIRHHGPLPFIPVRFPTSEEVLNCDIIELTSESEWMPYESNISSVRTGNISARSQADICYISQVLMGDNLDELFSADRLLFEDDDNEFRSIGAIATRRKDKVTPEDLSELLGIGLKTAKRTLAATTHQCIRTVGNLTRRFRTDKAHMRYKKLSTREGMFYVDTLFSKVISIRGFKCGNLYTTTLGFKKFFPMESKSGQEATATLQSLIELVGIPPAIHSDGAKEFIKGEFHKRCRKYTIQQTSTEPNSPWQNRAEGGIRELKKFAGKVMTKHDVPIRLWCFAYEYSAEVLSLLASGQYQLQHRTPYESVMNYTPDISEYVNFHFYQWCYYWDELDKEKKLARWLGVAHLVGQSMCYWILTGKGTYLSRSTVIPIPQEDMESDSLKERMKTYTASVHDVIGNHSKAIVRGETMNDSDIYHDAFFDQDDDGITYPWDKDLEDIPLSEETEASLQDLDEYINTNVILPGRDGVEVLCKVKGRKRDSNGSLVGIYNQNPILDTRVFNVEHPDGSVDEYATNVIAESLLSNVDDDGFDLGLVDEIIDHRRGEMALSTSEGFVQSGTTSKPVITTKGWDIKVKWTDGSSDWLTLSEVKNGNPLQLAEYAIAQKIHKEPAFNWWVTKVLRKRDRIINKVTSRIRKGTMKFGVEIPTDVNQAMSLDRDNGNTFWMDAIKKEYENVKIAFKKLDDDKQVPPGFTEITCHLVFEVKFDLRRKARYVAGGHLTDVPPAMTYSSVVSRESIRIGFLIAALNGLDVLAADIQNAYLNAPTQEKVWFRAGPEWGEHEGKPIQVVRALYGLKSSGQAWRTHFSQTLEAMGFKSSLADPDVWMKAATKPNGEEYYAYIMVYVDDLLCIGLNPQQYMDRVSESFKLKAGSVGPPKVYLGANCQQNPSRTPDVNCWGMSAEQYVRDAVKTVKTKLKKEGFEFNKKLSDPKYRPRQPFSNVNYRPELDVTEACNDSQVSYYYNLIGVLRWMIELGRIDIYYEVSVLSQQLAYPREGHLTQVFHIFKYLDTHKENMLNFDPTYLSLPEPLDPAHNTQCKVEAMKKFYPDAGEAIPDNAPRPRGKEVQINTFVDADHAGNKVTRRSHTGILIFLNMAPIYWMSKRQNCVETSTYSSEFVALKIAAEKIIALRYKLRMFGIPIDGPANVFCDNEAVYKNSSIAESTLKKKHNSVAFHKVRECTAASILIVHKEETGSNLADLFTKSLAADRRVYLIQRIMTDDKVKDIALK